MCAIPEGPHSESPKTDHTPSQIRQFHEVRLQGSPGPSEDPNADSYTLGQSPAPVVSSSPPKYGSGSSLAPKGEQRIPATLGGGGTDGGFGWDEGGRYLSQKWEGGTICDKTGMPRSVEVQVGALLDQKERGLPADPVACDSSTATPMPATVSR